jgi:ABC-type antimicrobial peptide transport system permease subunit
MAFVVDARPPTEVIAPALRAAIAAADRNLPVANMTSMADVTARFLSARRLSMLLMTTFALVAVVMAAVGIYAVVASLVAQRTREIGIRMALGADRSAVRRSVLIAGLRITLIGVGLGAIAAGAASTLVARFVPSLEPPTWTGVADFAVVLVAAATCAAWIPARRASLIDPIRTLRE